MSNFAIETFTTKTNKVDLVDAAHMNTVQTSLVNIETALNIAMQQDGSLNQGTSFPVSPTPINGQVFYRTDQKVSYIYDLPTTTWKPQSGITAYVAGNYLIAGPSAIVSQTTTGAMTKIVEMVLPRPGTLRIVFGAVDIPTSHTVAQIYRNGSAVGTLRTTASGTWTEWSEDIAGWATGDLLQLYADDTGGTDGSLAGALRIYENVPNREIFGLGGVGAESGSLKYTGNTTPPAALGNIGDEYFNNTGGTSTTLYVKTGASTWTPK